MSKYINMLKNKIIADIQIEDARFTLLREDHINYDDILHDIMTNHFKVEYEIERMMSDNTYIVYIIGENSYTDELKNKIRENITEQLDKTTNASFIIKRYRHTHFIRFLTKILNEEFNTKFTAIIDNNNIKIYIQGDFK